MTVLSDVSSERHRVVIAPRGFGPVQDDHPAAEGRKRPAALPLPGPRDAGDDLAFRAVVPIGRIRVAGLTGWLIWLAAHLAFLPWSAEMSTDRYQELRGKMRGRGRAFGMAIACLIDHAAAIGAYEQS